MILLKSVKALTAAIQKSRGNGASIGFVPTMGALHEGHLSLIRRSKMENALTICSIFVNPAQFNNADDFKKYPVTIEKDIDVLEKASCDILFLPDENEIYPVGYVKLHYDLGYLENVLEGKYRPGHFQGVCQVVDKLLDIVRPDMLYLGQKDFQQCMVIKKLVEIKDHKTSLVICSTLREEDGLAMSSRNARLDPEQRKQAVNIYETLSFIKKNISPGSLELLKQRAIENLSLKGFKLDYIEIADVTDLTLQHEWDGKKNIVALVAAYLNNIRLIDNMVLN